MARCRPDFGNDNYQADIGPMSGMLTSETTPGRRRTDMSENHTYLTSSDILKDIRPISEKLDMSA